MNFKSTFTWPSPYLTKLLVVKYVHYRLYLDNHFQILLQDIYFQTIIFLTLNATFPSKQSFSLVGCIRRLATERLKFSDKSLLLKTLLFSAVIYDKYTRIALDSDIVYSVFYSDSFGGNHVEM